VATYGFDTSVRTLQEFTRDKHAVKQSVLRTRAGGTTALFDAIAQVATEISTRSGKKALIVSTDGDDNASMLNLQAAMTRARKVGIPIYSGAQGDALSSAALVRQLRTISDFTNGLAHEVRKLHEVEAVFQDISTDLQHTYMLAYKPPGTPEKKWRSIRVSVNGIKGYKVRAREGKLPTRWRCSPSAAAWPSLHLIRQAIRPADRGGVPKLTGGLGPTPAAREIQLAQDGRCVSYQSFPCAPGRSLPAPAGAAPRR
jgi:hypothetical protein